MGCVRLVRMINHRKTRAEEWLHLLPRNSRIALILAETEEHPGHGGLQPNSNTSRSFYMHLRNLEGSLSCICSVKRMPVLQQSDTPSVVNYLIVFSIAIPISSRGCSLFEFYLKLFSYSRSLKALIKIISLTITMILDKCSSRKIFSNNSRNILAEYHTSHISQNTSPTKRYPLLRYWAVPFQSDHRSTTSGLDREQRAFTSCLNCHRLSEALRGWISTLH